MGKRVLSALLLLVCLTACNRDPNVAKRKYVDSGNRFFEKGKYKEALIMYRKALQRDLKYGEAYYRAGLADLKLQRWSEASRDLQRAVELQPENIDAYNRLTNLYLNAYAADRKRGKALLNELQALSDKYTRHFPNSYEDAKLKGYLALFGGSVKDAVEHFGKANRIKPYQSDLVLIYMQALAASERAEEAEKLGLEVIEKQPAALPIYDALFAYYVRAKRLPEAQRMLQQKVEKNPKNVDVYLQLAAYHFSLKEREPMMNTLARVTSNKKDFPQGAKYVGDFFMRFREFDLALQQYRDGEKNASDGAEKHAFQKRMIEALVKQNKKDEAQRIIEQVIKEDPKDSEAIAIRASISLLGGSKEQVQSALNDLQSVVSKMPNNAVVRYNLGRALLATQNVPAARVQFEEAIKLEPNYVLPRVSLAEIMLRNGEFQKVVQSSQDILTIDPSNAAARLLRSRALIAMNDTKGAREVLTQTPGRFAELPEARLQLATLDLRDRNYKQAEEGFRSLYAQSQDLRAFMGLVETQVAQKQFPQAMKMLRDESAKHPDRMEYRAAIGNLAVGTGDYATAISEYKKILEKVPSASDIWMRLGETHRRMGDTVSAIAAYKKAQELAPNNAHAIVQLALLHETEGRRTEAKPYYEQALRVQPNNMIALNNLAYMMADTGADLDQALTMAQKAKQQQPNDSNITDTLSWIYIKKNLPDTAINLLREIVQKDPERATYRYHLAVALHQKGDKAQAKREAELALKSKPAKEEEAKIRDLLSKLG